MFKKDTTFMLILAGSVLSLFLICMIFSCGMADGAPADDPVPTEETTPVEMITSPSDAQTTTTGTTADEHYYAVIVKSDQINVRTGPSKDNDRLFKAYTGDKYYCTGEETDSEGEIWYKISLAGTNGFIMAKYCDKVEIPLSQVNELVNPTTKKSTSSTSTTTTTTTTSSTESTTTTGTSATDPAPTDPPAPSDPAPTDPPAPSDPPAEEPAAG